MFAVPGVASENKNHSEPPLGLRPIVRPSNATSARIAVTTVLPSGFVT